MRARIVHSVSAFLASSLLGACGGIVDVTPPTPVTDAGRSVDAAHPIDAAKPPFDATMPPVDGPTSCVLSPVANAACSPDIGLCTPIDPCTAGSIPVCQDGLWVFKQNLILGTCVDGAVPTFDTGAPSFDAPVLPPFDAEPPPVDAAPPFETSIHEAGGFPDVVSARDAGPDSGAVEVVSCEQCTADETCVETYPADGVCDNPDAGACPSSFILIDNCCREPNRIQCVPNPPPCDADGTCECAFQLCPGCACVGNVPTETADGSTNANAVVCACNP